MSTGKLKLVVQGATAAAEVPGLTQIANEVEVTCATSLSELQAALPGAEVLLGWDFRAEDVATAWPHADALRWIQWGGAGEDTLLFPALAESEVVVTNAGGLFDRPMAEYVLGVILMHAKRMRETLALQARAEWNYRLNTRVLGQHAVVIGVGSIGREIGRLLRAVGLRVTGVGRRPRDADPDFGSVRGVAELLDVLPDADYVVLIAPLTAASHDLIAAPQIAAMKPGAYVINVGRGELLDEGALIAALDAGALSGAALDVFRTEPLPSEHPFWTREDVLVSPHVSGDYFEFKAAVAELFLENFRRYRRGETLLSVVDKQLGFVPSVSG